MSVIDNKALAQFAVFVFKYLSKIIAIYVRLIASRVTKYLEKIQMGNLLS